MPQGANGATSTGNGSGNGSGTRTRESKTKGVDKKALRRQQEDTEKQPKQKVIEEKAKKAGKRKAEKVRSQEMITRGLKRVGGNRTYQTKPRPMKGEELAWDNGEGNMEIHGEAIEYSLWLQALAAGLATITGAASTNDTLVPLVFTPLPLGSISPVGWLKDQMRLMADGLAGHEYDFYNYVAHSSWLGQNMEYSDLNEATPYWLNGLVPLAYGLDDAGLKDQVTSAASYILDHQWDDGWIGPENGTARNFWGRMPLFLGMVGLAEADPTWEAKIVPALHKFNILMNTKLKDNYTYYWYHEGDILSEGDTPWGRVRNQDMVITLQWLYEHHPGNQSGILLENMKMLHDGGLNWEDWYNEAAYFGQGMENDLNTLNVNLTNENYPFEHGVNVGQGLKAVAVVRRFTHNDSLIQTAMDGVNWTFTYHGAASGTVLADERLVGLAPYSGSEFCTAVETTYSLAYLYQALGTNYYADRAELTAFNAVPAMATPDWWGRQYMEEPNQPYAVNLTESPYYNTNSWGTTFGLEPNYPCCTVNHPQGLPKFLANSYVQVGDNGLAHALLSPGSAKATLSSRQVTVDCETAYPFLDTLSYTVKAAGAMAFYVRVPAWAGSDASIKVGSKTSSLSPDSETGLHRISLNKGSTTITYTLPSNVRTESRENDTIAVYKGPLLYALEITNYNTSTLPKPWNNTDYGHYYYPADYAPPQSRDWSYHNTSAWNYAIDPSSLKYHGPGSTYSLYTLPSPVFSPGAPPGYITAQGCEIDWPMAFNGSVPGYPPTGDAKKCIGKKVEVKLVPYASAKTHMAELPVIN